jgi:hypothetical protein
MLREKPSSPSRASPFFCNGVRPASHMFGRPAVAAIPGEGALRSVDRSTHSVLWSAPLGPPSAMRRCALEAGERSEGRAPFHAHGFVVRSALRATCGRLMLSRNGQGAPRPDSALQPEETPPRGRPLNWPDDGESPPWPDMAEDFMKLRSDCQWPGSSRIGQTLPIWEPAPRLVLLICRSRCQCFKGDALLSGGFRVLSGACSTLTKAPEGARSWSALSSVVLRSLGAPPPVHRIPIRESTTIRECLTHLPDHRIWYPIRESTFPNGKAHSRMQKRHSR